MWGIWLGLLVVLVIGGVAAVTLVIAFGGGRPQDTIRLESLKLAGTIAVGTGGIAALVLTARRQYTTEHDLLQKSHDANERRVTELYTAAATQLASDKAPVRMAGLYALERLGQANPDHRQTIINLFCAYLRMPYPTAKEDTISNSSPQPKGSDSGRLTHVLVDLSPALTEAVGISLDNAEQVEQERQVRLTAQRLITRHLMRDLDDDGLPRNPEFWEGPEGTGLSIDLSGAYLENWGLPDCSVGHARFHGTHFIGTAIFLGCKFHESVYFRNSRFNGYAWFKAVEFHGSASFDKAKFKDRANFDGSHFHTYTTWVRARFKQLANFRKVQFERGANFTQARFSGNTLFVESTWSKPDRIGMAYFKGARFQNLARFNDAEFHAYAQFSETHFNGTAQFDGTWFINKNPRRDGEMQAHNEIISLQLSRKFEIRDSSPKWGSEPPGKHPKIIGYTKNSTLEVIPVHNEYEI